MSHSVRQKLGAIAFDLPRFVWTMRKSSRNGWVFMRNRDEQLLADSKQLGARCNWQWTSDLHIAKIFPAAGRALMKRAVSEWPIEFRAEPAAQHKSVDVSFVIGHRGLARLPHLLATLQTIAAQQDVSFECVVVEQSVEREIEALLPAWVRYAHTPIADPNMPYSRSWTFNAGAEVARGKVLLFHDNDMLVPQRYAAEILAKCAEGYEVVNAKRFIFYLNRKHSEDVGILRTLKLNQAPETVVQNLEAGGSFGITREAYFALGGFDESFVGWGGEDNEFWERAQTRKVWPYGYMPLIHLWHEAQPEKHDLNRSTARLLEERSFVPVEKRIQELTARNFAVSQR